MLSISLNILNLGQNLAAGEIAVIPTDTIHGLVTSAFNQPAVEKIYQLKRRNPTKPYIILISSLEDLALFKVQSTSSERQILARFWPGPVSIILPCAAPELAYLHRGGQTLAFRMPADEALQKLLAISGPIVAPSANPEGQPPAQSYTEARAYFGDRVQTYICGDVSGRPSKLIRISDGTIEVLRP